MVSSIWTPNLSLVNSSMKPDWTELFNNVDWLGCSLKDVALNPLGTTLVALQLQFRLALEGSHSIAWTLTQSFTLKIGVENRGWKTVVQNCGSPLNTISILKVDAIMFFFRIQNNQNCKFLWPVVFKKNPFGMFYLEMHNWIWANFESCRWKLHNLTDISRHLPWNIRMCERVWRKKYVWVDNP